MEELNQDFLQLGNKTFIQTEIESVEQYYQQVLFPRLAENLPDEEFDYDFYRPRNPANKYLQYHYIANNPHLVGKKERLSDAGDRSQYTQSHRKYHPIFREIIE